MQRGPASEQQPDGRQHRPGGEDATDELCSGVVDRLVAGRYRGEVSGDDELSTVPLFRVNDCLVDITGAMQGQLEGGVPAEAPIRHRVKQDIRYIGEAGEDLLGVVSWDGLVTVVGTEASNPDL
jgi:hypothetical protein